MNRIKTVKNIVAIIMALILSVSLLPVTTVPVQAAATANYNWYDNAGGAGGTTYLISTAEELLGFALLVRGQASGGRSVDSFWGKTVKLTGNIDLSSVCGESASLGNWPGIGRAATGRSFSGTFDGDGYEVQNLYINSTETYSGLFQYAGDLSVIKNLGVSGSIESTGQYSAGIASYSSGTISNCYNNCNVTGSKYVGGIVASGQTGCVIEKCYNMGEITASGSHGAGIVAALDGGTIKNCYNVGVIEVDNQGGGIAGSNTNGTFENCYNSASVSGGDKMGGILGSSMGGTVSNCVSLGETITGTTNVGRISGVTGAFSNNVARSDMSVVIGGVEVTTLDNKDADKINGADISVTGTLAMSEVFGSSWSSEVWKFTGTNKFITGTKLPTLKGIAVTQNPRLLGTALSLNSIEVTHAPSKTTYTVGEYFDSTGMEITAKYSDNSTEVVTGYTVSPSVALAVTNKSVTISYAENGTTKTATQAITVNAATPSATVTAVKITPASAIMIQGKSKTFTATVSGTGSPSQSVTWSVSGNKSKNTKITAAGKLTVGADEKATSLTVMAVSKADKTKSKTAKVTVAAKLNAKFTSGNFTYIITSDKTDGKGTVTLTGIVKGKKVTRLTVPTTVKCQSISYKVTAVGDKAFDHNKLLKKAVIGNNVTKIGKNAFRDCTGLTEVTVGNKVTKILSGAFLRCTSLKIITIGTGLKEIGTHAFCMDKALRTMIIKSTKLTKVGNHSMNDTNNLKIKVPAAKVSAYKMLFANKEQGKNVKVVKQ